MPNNLIQTVVNERTGLTKLIIITVFVSFGVSLVASSIASNSNFSSQSIIFIGILISLLGIIYLLKIIFGNTKRKKIFQGFFIHDAEKNDLLEIPEFLFSMILSGNLHSAFKEDLEMKKIWENEPIRKVPIPDPDISRLGGFVKTEDGSRIENSSLQIICEVVEHYTLTFLSGILESHFAKNKIDSKELKTLTRDDVKQLLDNRFLSLFSKPMHERPPFILSRKDEAAAASHENFLAYGIHGEQFQLFEIVLPKDANITRPGKNIIQIETKYIKILIETECPGYNTNVSHTFLQYFIGIGERIHEKLNWGACGFVCLIKIEIEFKPRLIFSKVNQQYVGWIDSFLEFLQNDFTEESFYKKIGWENASSITRTVSNLMEQKTKQKKSGRKKPENS